MQAGFDLVENVRVYEEHGNEGCRVGVRFLCERCCYEVNPWQREKRIWKRLHWTSCEWLGLGCEFSKALVRYLRMDGRGWKQYRYHIRLCRRGHT